MARLKFFTTLFLVVLTPILVGSVNVGASHCPAGDYDCRISEIQGEIDALKPAHEKNERELQDLKDQVKGIQQRISSLTVQAKALEQDILQREADLIVQQELLNERARSFYIRSRQFSPVIVFLSSLSATEFTREIVLRGQAAAEDRRVIDQISEDLLTLKEDKVKLENTQAGLRRLQAQLDDRADFLEVEVAKVESYLAQLTAKQQELLAAKAGGFQTSIGDTPPTLDPCSGPPGSDNFCDPGSRPAFAGFSFGAPHRAGMSQYGAYGRAKSDQSAEQILQAYYQGASLNTSYSVPSTINVSGHGNIPFEDNYLLGIYEVPESWGDKGGFEALKAQAVAARTYALAVTNNGQGTICPTESCQVYKPQLKSGKWAEAVKATRGWVLVRDGQPAKTYYASTAGGFTLSKWGWTGIKDAAGDWPDQAYEKIAGSPWFYKAWFKTRSGATCGRSHPWLTEDEMADILNAWQVLNNPSGADTSRISPINTDCWPGDPYPMAELRNLGGFTKVSSASVIYGNDGSTIKVSFSTNKGIVDISGEDFKKAFNLRAPGYIGIKSSLYNLVRI